MIKHIIIEGVDRLGKDTLIKGIQDRLGFFQVLHYQKPLLLDYYVKASIMMHGDGVPSEIKKQSLWLYQQASFRSMFSMMASSGTTRFICNRSHLGESVYSKRYRNYGGNYVFDIEESFNYSEGPLEKVLLVLLQTSDFSFVSDDGESLDVTKREEEQADFIDAFHRSIIKNKLALDVHDGHGQFVSPEKILNSVIGALTK